MANYERGTDDVRVFDGGDDEEDVEGSRLPLLIVIALLVLAAFGAVVWLAYQRGVQQGHSDVPRVIAAEPGPAKVAPGSAGGTPTPYTGLKIYQQPAPSDEEANADTVPPPPTAVPTTTAPATAPSTMAAAAPPAVTPKPQTAPATTPTATTPPPAMTAAKPPVTTPPPAMTAAKPPVATPPPATVKPAPLKPTPTAAVTPPVVKPPVDTPVATAPAASGGALLQIGSYKSAADANAAWAAYKARHASLVSGLSPDVKQVDLGAKGTWYRLRIPGGKALCEKLTADGGVCIPTK